MTQQRQISAETARAIDQEVRIIIDRNYQRAKDLLSENMDKLHAMAEALLRFETIDRIRSTTSWRAGPPLPPRTRTAAPTPPAALAGPPAANARPPRAPPAALAMSAVPWVSTDPGQG